MEELVVTNKAVREDGWNNIISGLGSAAAKQKYTKAIADGILSDDECEVIYTDDGLGSRIVDLIPDDMFRKGWTFDFDDVESQDQQKEYAQYYIDAFDAMNVKTQLNFGEKWGRLYGGAIGIIGALDGRGMDKQIIPKSIKEWDEIRIIDRSDISFAAIEFQMDPKKKRYMKPEFYTVKIETGIGASQDQRVHWSRVLEFHGKMVPQGSSRRLDRERRYWGLSVLQPAYEMLASVGSSFGAINQLIQQASVGKYKLKDLADILAAPEGEKAVQRRIQAMDLMQSVFHGIFMDADEDFVRENISFAGLSDIIYQLFTMLSAQVGIPLTRLFGVSPAGLNSTGESDQLNYYDMVASTQEITLAPKLRYLTHLVAEKENIPEPNIKFNALKQMTDKENSDLKKQDEDSELVKAQRYQAYMDMGVMEAYQVEHIEFGDALQNIPAPKDLELPPVQPIPSGVPPVAGAAPNPIGTPPATGDPPATVTKTPQQLQADTERLAELEGIGDSRTQEEEEEYQDLLAQAKANEQQ
jgi:phage-related protein (TIGR01555 family)